MFYEEFSQVTSTFLDFTFHFRASKYYKVHVQC